jgi:hypothetical protein
MSATYAFTDAQKVDLRRFMGYTAMGSLDSGEQSWRYFQIYGVMEFRIANLSTEEGNVVVNTYLTNLTTLEIAVLTASGNLDTDRASVWFHNRQEIAHRERLFDDWRRRLCGFLGLPPGPALQQSSNLMAIVV